MERYRNINNDSGVNGYEYGEDWILVTFNGGTRHEYTYRSAGQNNIEEMKRLADRGSGLNAFIKLNVNNKYSKK